MVNPNNIENKVQVANFLDMIGGELKEKISAPRGSKYAPEDSLFDAVDDITVKSEMLKNEIRNEIRSEQERMYYERLRQNGYNSYMSPPVTVSEPLHQLQYKEEVETESSSPIQMELPLFNNSSNNVTINTDKLEVLLKENIEVTNKINKSVTSILIGMNNNISECTEILKEILAVLSVKGVVTMKSDNDNNFDLEEPVNENWAEEFSDKEKELELSDDKKES